MKFTGITLIILTVFVTVHTTIKKELLRCKHIENIIQTFEFIKLRTTHYSEPVASIIKDNRTNNDIFNEFTILCDKGAEPDKAWLQAIDSSEMLLLSDEKKLLAESFNDICSSSIEVLNEKCNNYINEFKNIKNKNLADKERNIKISISITVAIGLLIILIFI